MHKMHKILDCVGTRCPFGVVKTAAALEKMNYGEILKISSDDHVFSKEISIWADNGNGKIVDIVYEKNQTIVYIKK